MTSTSLPSGVKWYHDGTEVTELPQGLSYSVQLVREGTTPEEKPTDPDTPGVDDPTNPDNPGGNDPSNPGTLPDTLAMDDTGVHIAAFCIFAVLALCAYRQKKK